MAGEKPTTLLVRHLPRDLLDQERIDLLCHFGAERVRPMGTQGPMKHSAFAQFNSKEVADICIKRLHQMDILGCKLVVEYAKEDQKKHFPTDTSDTGKPNKLEDVEKDQKEDTPKTQTAVKRPREETSQKDPVFAKHDIPFPRKPNLFYRYPPPTVSTLTNIANALASHSRFYTQVLHLMNKMNLPCPFGAVTATPPIALDVRAEQRLTVKSHGNNTAEVGGEIEEVEMEYASTEESELETDDEVKKADRSVQVNVKQKKILKRPRKKMKLVQPDLSTMVKAINPAQPREVFENVDSRKPTQIMFKLSDRDSSEEIARELHQKNLQHAAEIAATEANVTVVEGGFGKVEPATKPKVTAEQVQKPDVNFTIEPEKFISTENIATGRLKKGQMKEFSVFKNYAPGETTSRLYIKNLTKHTTEQDLVNLFGSFVDWNLEMSYIAFDIRLMKEGRMKGQAFVTLPDEESARNIVSSCNGFIMNGKPIVIQFARSAKAKEVDNKT